MTLLSVCLFMFLALAPTQSGAAPPSPAAAAPAVSAAAPVAPGGAAATPAPAPPQVTEAIISAPPSELWRVFTTAEGFKLLGVAQCEMDFRVGGLIRSHYNPKGVLGDEGTIVQEILSYEPQRMFSFRIHKAPKGFPSPEEVWNKTWNVVTFTDLGDGRTQVRLAGQGYTDDEQSRKLRDFFEAGNAWVMTKLKQHYDEAAPQMTRGAHAVDALAPVVVERVIERPAAEVWSTFTTPAGWKEMFGANANIELQPHGRFEILFNSDAPPGSQGSEGCKVLTVVPGRMLSFDWNAPPKFERARQERTWVVVEFDELAPGRTRLRITHQGFSELAAAHPEQKAEYEAVRDYFNSAWRKVAEAAASGG